jgi:nucleoid DNA-binding protein
MAKKIQAWTEFGPRLEPTNPMTDNELIENIVAATNQSRGSVLAVLAELDVQIESALKAGRIVHLLKWHPLQTHRQERRFREY